MSDDAYLVWSNKHMQWWRGHGRGYTSEIDEAGEYSREDAIKACESGLYSSLHMPKAVGGALVPSSIIVLKADAFESTARFYNEVFKQPT